MGSRFRGNDGWLGVWVSGGVWTRDSGRTARMTGGEGEGRGWEAWLEFSPASVAGSFY